MKLHVLLEYIIVSLKIKRERRYARLPFRAEGTQESQAIQQNIIYKNAFLKTIPKVFLISPKDL